MQAFKAQKLFYGWIVVAVTAITLFVSAGVRSAPGVFLSLPCVLLLPVLIFIFFYFSNSKRLEFVTHQLLFVFYWIRLNEVLEIVLFF